MQATMTIRLVFYVVIYNHSQNVYARYVLTAKDRTDAKQQVLAGVGSTWRIHGSEIICTTSDASFCQEL